MSEKIKKGHGKIKGALLLGLMAGAVYGFLTMTKKGQKTNKDLDKKFKKLVTNFQSGREDMEVKLKRIFGVVSKEAIETYGRIKGEIMATLSTATKDIKPGEYEQVVDQLIKKYQKKFKLAAGVASRLKDELISGFSVKNRGK